MENSRMFWDKKITKKEAEKILRNGSDPRFIEYAALFLSRTNEPKTVFTGYIDKKTFCRQWRKIKRRMRLNKWSDNKIIFWDEVFRVVSRHFSKDELRAPKERREAIDPDIIRIGKTIKDARKNKGWTQAALAEKAGFSQQTVSFVESGYINVSFLTLKKITDALGLKVLITGETERSAYSTFTA